MAEYNAVRLPENADIEGVDRFLKEYVRARIPMVEAKLLSNADAGADMLVQRELEDFKTKIAGSPLREYVGTLVP